MFSSSKDKPTLQVNIIECKDLFDPRSYWKKYNRFAAYCLLEFQGNKMRTHDAVATNANPVIPPWNETFNFKVDTKKITPANIPILTIELWQGKMKEYWQSNKDLKICSVQVPLNNLMDDKPYENFIQLPRGILHISMIRSNINQVLPPPIAPSFTAPPHPTAPPSNLPPTANMPINMPVNMPPPTAPQPGSTKAPPPVYIYNPQQYPNMPPSNTPIYMQQQAPNMYPPVYANMYTPTAPEIPPTYTSVESPKPPTLPPKIVLPDHISSNTVIAMYGRATQPVSETILSNYFKFCGSIVHMFKSEEGPFVIIYFSKIQEAETALLLDNGIVCGGPIQVFRYKDYPQIVTQNRGPVERIAKRLADVTQNVTQNVVEEKEIEQVNYPSLEPANTANVFVKNISNKVTTDMLADFFSYCGTVTKISVFKQNDSQVAIVYFEKKESSTTALLLSGAMIQDRVIEVEILTPEKEKELSKMPSNSTSHKTNEKMSTESSKSSVVASLLAAGYNVGNTVMTKARRYDETHFQLVQALDKAKAKIIDIDNKYEISKKVEKGYEYGKDALINAFGSFGFKKQPASPQTPQQQQQQQQYM